MAPPHEINCELAILGAGLCGMAAALFAVNRGISTVQIGCSGELQLTSGLMDLMGVHPVEDGVQWHDPWKALAALAEERPEHPLNRLAPGAVAEAFDEVFAFLESQGLPYRHRERNVDVMTFAGTRKRTFGVPLSMWAGVEALEAKAPCCIAAIDGLKGFSAVQIVAHLQADWPGLRAVSLRFPGTRGEVHSAHLSALLEDAAPRAAFCERLKAEVGDARAVGLPAVIGLQRGGAILRDMAARIGAAVFEVPTLPPSMAGIRLRQAFEQGLAAAGVHQIYQQKVWKIEPSGRGWRLRLEADASPGVVRAEAVLLATGRFFGGGLRADRRRVREAILDLPVHQPDRRDQWHDQDAFAPAGHPVNQAGLMIDAAFRPVDRTGRFSAASLYAAGSILAHQDWKRMKCGSGLALATAFGAVNAYLEASGPRASNAERTAGKRNA
jgi:glycerol-3-phosphate dehydrogenase subunit B